MINIIATFYNYYTTIIIIIIVYFLLFYIELLNTLYAKIKTLFSGGIFEL